MKIKLAIIDSDCNYISHIVSVFADRYSDSVEISSFTGFDKAQKELRSKKVHVILADSKIPYDIIEKPENCGFAYLVDSSGITAYNGQRAICKYQKIDAIYNTVLDLYSENSKAEVAMGANDQLPIFVFTSASGGIGVSSAAVACAKSFSFAGKSTIYISLEKLSNPNLYFTGLGGFDMSDVIFALKSKRPNLQLKLKSNVHQDLSGVYWFAAPKNPLDLLELTRDDVVGLMETLRQMELFETIVVDTNFGVDDNFLTLARAAYAVIFLTDGTNVANDKLIQAYNILSILENSKNLNIISKMAVLYNKFKADSGEKIDIRIREVGSLPHYGHISGGQIISRIQNAGVFTRL